MNRRNLLQLTLASAAASVAAPRLAAAEEAPKPAPSMAGGVYFTSDHPGRWSKKVKSHVPQIEKTVGPDGALTLKITTNHKQYGYEHYIVKHVLLDGSYDFLAETMFDPEKDDAVSTYKLPDGYSGPVYALSMCNKHDLWLAEATI